jgi:hypothetical protein
MNPVSELPSPVTPSSGPHGLRRTLCLLLALFGAPLAWVIQLTASEPLAAYGCYPYQVPLSAPLWEGLPWLLAAISAICLGIALVSGFIAWKLWHDPMREPAGSEGDAGMRSGRTRFLIKLGLMSSFIFIVAVIFNVCAVLLVPLCHSGF